jgi:thiosulfate/3-mercaptopyruvate sulfurtransferase
VNTTEPRERHLVTATALARELEGERPPRVLDVRWTLHGRPGVIGYQAGHLPGAVFVDLSRDLAGAPGLGGRHPLPEPRVLAGALRRSGIDADSEIVLYDDTDATAAARAWWTLRYFGHQRVRVLDGGLRAWRAAGLPVSTEEVDVPPGTYDPRGGCMPVLDAAGAATVARDGVLLDARTPERYRGEQELIDPVAGHIPGAVNAPTAANLDAEGRFRPAEELRARFAALGAVEQPRVGAYCGSGITAAHTVLALAVAGIPSALYVGSWSGWITDPTRPVALGPSRGRLPATP